jgi:hypothetical protein
MLNYLSSMRSVSIALLQVIDQRLCALISRTNTSYLGVALADREAAIKKHKFVYRIAGDGDVNKERLNQRFGKLEDTACVVFCRSGGTGDLTVKGGVGDYPIFKCSSVSSVMQDFSIYCDSGAVNLVNVSEDGTTITLNDKSIQF